MECNYAVVVGDDQGGWFTLSGFAEATSKETSLSADCYFYWVKGKVTQEPTTTQQDAY